MQVSNIHLKFMYIAKQKKTSIDAKLDTTLFLD